MRAPRHEDAEAVVTLMRACDVVVFGEPETDIKDVRDDWAAPGFELARDGWIIDREDGTALGFAWIHARRPGSDFDGALYVLPGEPIDPIAPVLLGAVQARAREKASEPGATLCFFVAQVEAEMRSLLERFGYQEARTFFRMRIDLEGLELPRSRATGIEIRPHRLGTDDRVTHAAIEESFAEHFRHTPRAFDDWWALRSRHERFDPGLWLLAWDREQVAGALVAFDYGDAGFVRELGVLKPWRGKGVGSALLLRSFEEFRSRGQPRVILGVDAENESAIVLYERVGMRVDGRHYLMRRPVGA
jgi:mycothiol synthase